MAARNWIRWNFWRFVQISLSIPRKGGGQALCDQELDHVLERGPVAAPCHREKRRPTWRVFGIPAYEASGPDSPYTCTRTPRSKGSSNGCT